jgi:hypothetical protein
MKVKIVGFKVGVSRPTYNRTLDTNRVQMKFGLDSRRFIIYAIMGEAILKALEKSDFLSIRRVD